MRDKKYSNRDYFLLNYYKKPQLGMTPFSFKFSLAARQMAL
jgi:hypothetical protein